MSSVENKTVHLAPEHLLRLLQVHETDITYLRKLLTTLIHQLSDKNMVEKSDIKEAIELEKMVNHAIIDSNKQTETARQYSNFCSEYFLNAIN